MSDPKADEFDKDYWFEMYQGQCATTDEWAKKYRDEVERKADATLLARCAELQRIAEVANAMVGKERDQVEAQAKRIAELEAALETERMRLAGCSIAALGYYKEGDGIKEEYKSASLADVCRLYQEVTRLRVDAAIGAVVWKYIDRMNDVVPSDPAERILCEFCHAVQPVMDAAKELA